MGRLRTEGDGERELLEGGTGDREAGALAESFVGAEAEVLVAADAAAKGTPILLPTVVGLGVAGVLIDLVDGLDGLAAKETVQAAVEVVAAGLGDDVEGGAFAAAVLGGETVGGYLELLDGLEGKLHDGAADGVVFVVDAVDGGVGVASA